MKKGLIFFLGMVAGCILTIAALCAIGLAYQRAGDMHSNTNFTFAEQQTVFTTATKFEVFQVLGNGALANCEEKMQYNSYFSGPIVYIVAEGQNLFYDDEVIEVPKGKTAMQIGTYRYQSKLGEKVVPVIQFQ